MTLAYIRDLFSFFLFSLWDLINILPPLSLLWLRLSNIIYKWLPRTRVSCEVVAIYYSAPSSPQWL